MLYWWISGLILLLAVLAALMWMHVQVRIDFLHRDSDTDGVVHMTYLFGLVHVHRRLFRVETVMTDEGPSVQVTHGTHPDPSAAAKASASKREKSVLTLREGIQILRNWPEWVRLVKDAWDTVEALLRRVHFQRCDIEAWVGTGEVVSTGVAYGSLWAVASSIVGRLTYLCAFDAEPRIFIQPNFRETALGTDVHCIVRVRAGYAMLAAMRLLRVWKRRKPDGPSHSGTHENGHGKHP